MSKNISGKTGFILFLSFLTFLLSLQASAQKKGLSDLEKQVQKAVAIAISSSVYITDYDPVAKAPVGSRFSGVTVSADGTILTVGHTTVPGASYMVTFPDGKECTATCLGRISGVDAAMLKINEKGAWPFAEMGYSSSLKEKEPCISISYPASFESNILLVRFGFVAEVSTSQRANRIRTTLLMEPGDSGGPAFDLLGRVIGMHSSIDSSLVNNFEVPIDLYRKYWHALEQQIAYEVLPMGEMVGADSLSSSKSMFNNLTSFKDSFDQLSLKLNNSSLKLSSTLSGKTEVVNSTLISLKGLAPAKKISGKSYLISKNSMVGDHPVVYMSGGKTVDARIVYRDNEKDLVLLELAESIKGNLEIKSLKTAKLNKNDLGRFLFSPQPSGEGKWGVLGTPTFDLPKRFRAGYSGAYPVMKDGKLQIGMVGYNSAAKLAKVNVGDEVMSINGIKVDTQESFMKEMKKTLPGDNVILQRKVSGVVDTVNMTMLKYPQSGDLHPAERFFGGKSNYRDGFDGVFVQDAKIIPSECGGPVLDINGNLLGVNIARYSRTSTIVSGTSELKKFIEASMSAL